MELNIITSGIELLGTTVKNLVVENTIVDVEQEAKRSFGLNINEPELELDEGELYARILVDIEIEIEQSEAQKCEIQISIEGAFMANGNVSEETFRQLVSVNGAAAVIGIARGKIEALSGNVFNNGKIVIPFVNVIEYYRSIEE